MISKPETLELGVETATLQPPSVSRTQGIFYQGLPTMVNADQ